MKKIVLASHNLGKLKEFKTLFNEFNIEIVPLGDFTDKAVEENGLSFIENSLIKARYAAKLANCPAIADDSGLVVPALNGKPGIYSARFAGVNASDNDNIDCLLDQLQLIDDKGAYFYCAMSFIRHHADPTPVIATGHIDGEILTERRGISGFGYDPIFFVKQKNKTMAELSMTEKNQISHRAIATQALFQMLRKDKVL